MLTFAPFQFPLNGLSDQVKPGLTILQNGVHPLDLLLIQRKGQALCPKFFSSHDLFSYVRY